MNRFLHKLLFMLLLTGSRYVDKLWDGRFGVRIPGKTRNFRFSKTAQTDSGAQHPPPFKGVLLLLQSALQPLWVLACSTIVEYSQQECFYRVPLPVAHQTPNLEDQ